MEMTQIRYFIAVSETLNFTRAAELCFISQPALTKGIKKLEESIGGELLHRTKSSVGLSYLGQQLLPKFQKIYQEANIAKEEAKRLITETDSVLRIGIQNNVFIGSILPIFQGFQTENENNRFEFVENDQFHLRDKLDNHELDIIFLSSLKGIDEDDNDNVVCNEEFVIAFGNKHKFSGRNRISINELNNERYCFRTHCNSSMHFCDYLKSKHIDLSVVYSSSKDDWVRSFVTGNFGLTFIPKSQALCEGMCFVELDDYQVSRSVVFKTCSKEHRLYQCQRFLDALPLLTEEYCRQLHVKESDDNHGLPGVNSIKEHKSPFLNVS